MNHDTQKIDMITDVRGTLEKLARTDIYGAALLAIQTKCFCWFFNQLTLEQRQRLNPALR